MPKVSIVTGANQGLGLALVRGLCRDLPPGSVVYLTARNQERGTAAQQLLEREGFSSRFERLDVTDDAGVSAFAAAIRERHGGVDIVISNAAARIVREKPPSEQIDEFVETNNHGTYRMLRAFCPLLKDGARLIVVASAFGTLRHLPENLRSRFTSETLSLEAIEREMEDYAALVKSGSAAARGWPDWINIPSKIAQVASMRVCARSMHDEARRRGILINAVCPGLVDTEASRPWFDDMSKAQSPDAAAVDVLWLATLAPQALQPYGELVQHRAILPFR